MPFAQKVANIFALIAVVLANDEMGCVSFPRYTPLPICHPRKFKELSDPSKVRASTWLAIANIV